MKILYVTARFPYPPVKGDKLTPFNRIKLLSKNHEIHLISFLNPKENIYINKMKKYCSNIIVINHSILTIIISIIKTFLFSNLPLQIGFFTSNKMKNVLKTLDFSKYDIVNIFTLRMVNNFKIVHSNFILDLIDSMVINIQRRYKVQKNSYIKFILKLELNRLRKYENDIIKKFPKSILVSEIETRKLNNSKIITIPNGTLIPSKKFIPFKSKENIIIFFGNMSYYPNVNAVIWFIENCLYKIKEKIFDVHLKIVGINPHRILNKYINFSNITISGYVQDIYHEIQTAKISIAPMQSGSGMQNKILESMAMSIPVITTNLGLGAINAIPGEHIIIADTPEDFKNSCIKLLNDEILNMRIGENSKRLIENNYSWNKHCESLLKVYNQIKNDNNYF